MISGIIPVYNRSENLKKCLCSLNSQSFLIDEAVLSDDGSQEDILSAAKEILPELKFKVKYVRQGDKGFRAAKCRNNGIRESTGDYLIFIDQDLVLTRDYIRLFAEKKRKDTFLVAYPIRITEEQSLKLTYEMIEDASYEHLLFPGQIRKIRRQFIEDGFEYVLKRLLKTKSYKPKLRSGVFGVHRDQILRINGFDENYQGWGNEDDDLGRRFYKAGLIGRNVFYNEYPLHLFHPTEQASRERVNLDYYLQRNAEIKNGDIKARNGISDPLGNDEIKVVELN
jgi:glycosyltransferase involved in cell wall biosynthesis